MGQKIDWLNVVAPSDQLVKLIEIANEFLGEGTDQPHGMHRYRSSHKWETGAIAAWSEGVNHCLLSLNGDSCAMVPAEKWLDFLRKLEDVGARATRVDIAIDDYSRQLINLEEVHAAAAAGNFHGFKLAESLKPTRRVRGQMVKTGDSCTFGRKGKDGSGRQCIVYDKALESNGEVNSIRLEARFFKERAAIVFQCLASSFTLERMWEKARNFAGDIIDFIERGSHRHLSRMKRLGWWQRVVDVLGECAVVVERAKPSLQRSAEWIKKAVAPTAALIVDVFDHLGYEGERILLDLVRGARHKLAARREGARKIGLDLQALLSV